MKVLVFVALVSAIGCAFAAETPSADLAVTATRTIDVASQLVKTTTEYEIKNNGKAAVDSFLHGFFATEQHHLAWLGANWEKRDGKKLHYKKADVAGAGGDKVFYKIELREKIEPGATAKIVVRSELTQALKAKPATISQADQQFIVYDGDAYIAAAYVLERQSTAVKIGSAKALHFTAVEPSKQVGDSVKYGPYNKVALNAKKPINVHYENNAGFLVVTSLERWIEISHWGNIAVEDTVEVVHRGATLTGEFSRLDFQMDRRGSNAPVVKSFKTHLPVSSRDIYYRDQIGNISTSVVAKRANRVEVDLRPRFPLWGGWKTNYVLGYNVPSVGFLFSSGSDYALKFSFIDRLYDNAVIEKAVVRIVLPEAATNARLVNPFSIKQHANELHKTYLDTTGRTVLVLEKSNLVNHHVAPVTVYYEFDRIMLLREPLMAVVAFFLLFLAIMLFVRLDLSIEDKPESHLKRE